MENGNTQIQAAKGPICPKHGPMYWSSQHIPTMSTTGDSIMSVMSCHLCDRKVPLKSPKCSHLKCLKNPLKRHMNLVKGTEQGTYYWKCFWSHITLPLEICDSCDGVGWLHMNNGSRTNSVDMNLFTIGHDGGMHIERCDGCESNRFKDDIEADLAHRIECGCGHGLPHNNYAYTWFDYGGPDGDMFHALTRAGFSPTIEESDNIEKYRVIKACIPAGYGSVFIKTIDEVYGAYLTKRNAEKLASYSYGTALARASYLAASAKAGSIASEKYEDGVRKLGKQRENGTDVSMGAMVPYDICSICGHRSKVPKDYCDHVKNTESAVLETKATLELIPDILRQRLGALEKASTALVRQLGSMNFQDHPKKEQLEVDLARRGVLTALADITTGESTRNDRAAQLARQELFLVGGYRIDNLRKLEDENVLFGRCYLGGLYHHITLIEVHHPDGVQEPVNDPEERYIKTVGQFNDEAMATVKVPGFEGEYVLFIYPSTP